MCSQLLFPILLCYLSCMIALPSCTRDSKEDFIANINSFISEVDSKAAEYSEIDWQNADEQFLDYKDNQFPLWEDIMTPIEKAKVNELIGKYQAMQIKRGLHNLKNKIENTLDQTKAIFKELSEDSSLLK